MNEEDLVLKRNYRVLSNQLNDLYKGLINLSNSINSTSKTVKNNLILDNKGYGDQDLININSEIGKIIKSTQSLYYQTRNKSY